MADIIRIAQVKVVPAKGDLEANGARLMAVLGDLAAERPDVVVTPECFLDGYVVTEEGVSAADLGRYAVEPESSPLVGGVAAWARERSAWVVLGCSRRAPEGVYNSALVLGRDGRLAGWYDKLHLQAHDLKYLPGGRLSTFASDFGPFGVMICADRRWPETVRSLALQGARVIFNPTLGMHDERNFWMMRIRSYESEVFIAFTHAKQALVTGPGGRVVGNVTDDGTAYAVSEVDLAEVDAERAGRSAHLRDRRPDAYGL